MSRATHHSPLPGFALSLGITISWLCLIALIPLAALVLRAAGIGFERFLEVAGSDRALAAYRLTFGTSLAAAAVNVVCGLIVAFALSRYRFPGRRVIDALIDLPFALPTAVAGIALTALWAKTGWLGGMVAPVGIDVAFTPVGIFIALTFIGLPFVVRSVQPVIENLDSEIEEAAAILGASRVVALRRVVLPLLAPSLLWGFGLAFGRAIGEYGSVVFIAGNMPMKTEIAPLLIVTTLEQYDYEGATAIAVVMLVVSFVALFLVNLAQRRASSLARQIGARS
jgi:sulfate transport system permease protein